MSHRVASVRLGLAERRDALVRHHRGVGVRHASAPHMTSPHMTAQHISVRQTARRHAMATVRPSPARVDAPEPGAWIPILDLDLLAALGSVVEPALLRELEGLERSFLEPPAPASAPDPRLVPPPPAELPSAASDGVPAVPAPDSIPEPEPGPAPATAGPETGRHRLLHWVILAVGLAVVAGGLPYFLAAPAERRVTLDVDGVSFVRTTRAEDVGSLLTSAGIAVAPEDSVVPGPGAELRDDSTVRVVRAIPLTVEVDGARRAVHTSAGTVSRLRSELGIPGGLVAVGSDRRLRRGDTIVFRTPLAVTLVNDGVARPLESTAGTVGELLDDRGISFAAGDQIDPPLDTRLATGLTITVTHATAGRITEDAVVAFEVHERHDASVPHGTRHVVQSGVDGIDRTTYLLARDRDAVVGKDALGTVRVREPRPEIVVVGTRPVGGTGRQSGIATWYATLYQPGTCAHLTLPFGTVAHLTDTETGATATCRVADRGPEAWTGNIIDLSPDVFEQLRPLSTGKVRVRVDW